MQAFRDCRKKAQEAQKSVAHFLRPLRLFAAKISVAKVISASHAMVTSSPRGMRGSFLPINSLREKIFTGK
jgi:hypothetical protein